MNSCISNTFLSPVFPVSTSMSHTEPCHRCAVLFPGFHREFHTTYDYVWWYSLNGWLVSKGFPPDSPAHAYPPFDSNDVFPGTEAAFRKLRAARYFNYHISRPLRVGWIDTHRPENVWRRELSCLGWNGEGVMVNVTGEPMRLRGEEVNVAPPQVPVREDVPVRTAALSAEEKERLYDEAEAAINRYLAGGRPIRISFRPRKRAAPDDVTEEAPLAEGPSAQTAQREPKRSKRTKVAASASDVQPEVPDSSIQADTSCDEERIMEEAEEIQSAPPAMSSPQSVSIEAKIEEEAQPRLPMNMINSQEAELKEIQREKATKASQSQECKEKADQHKSRSASLRDELVSLSEQRQKAWEEYQRLSALHSEKERLLREEEEEESKAKAAMEGLDKEVAELESRSVVAEETLSRLRSNPVIDSRAQAEATLAVSRAIKLKDEGDTGASPK